MTRNTIKPVADFSAAGREKGGTDGAVSAQWARRPMDERYTSLDEMLTMLDARTRRSEASTIKIADVRPILDRSSIAFDLGAQSSARPTHHAFSQLCSQIGAPASFLRDIADDTDLVMRNLTRCFDRARKIDEPEHEPEVLALLTSDDKRGVSARGITGPKYGRIWDRDLVASIKMITEEGGGRWEVPQAFRTPDMAHHDVVDPTKEDTTLYAGDRSVFLFLVDQRNPIEVGMRNGKPDLYYRGFYAWNGECGGISNGCATFLYSMVCANRIIWNQKGFQRFSIRHTAHANERFVRELQPALRKFVDGSSAGIVDALSLAQTMKIGDNDETVKNFLIGRDLSPRLADRILARVIDEEGHPARSAWDVVQGITAIARDIGFQDERIAIEQIGADMMQDVMAAA